MPICTCSVSVIRAVLSSSTTRDRDKPTFFGGLYFCVYICVDNVNTAKLWYYLINERNLQKGRTLVIHKNWRGCENIDWGYYNTQADPDMLYSGYTFNYWDIEDAL